MYICILSKSLTLSLLHSFFICGRCEAQVGILPHPLSPGITDLYCQTQLYKPYCHNTPHWKDQAIKAEENATGKCSHWWVIDGKVSGIRGHFRHMNSVNQCGEEKPPAAQASWSTGRMLALGEPLACLSKWTQKQQALEEEASAAMDGNPVSAPDAHAGASPYRQSAWPPRGRNHSKDTVAPLTHDRWHCDSEADTLSVLQLCSSSPGVAGMSDS